MGINVSTTMGFENREFLRQAAKEILQKGGADSEKASEITQKIVLSNQTENTAFRELSALGVSTQIKMKDSLKETLKYLNAHARDKRKQYVLGELWQKFNEEDYQGELFDFEIDDSAENIFAA